MLELRNDNADIFVPDEISLGEALKRTTHVAVGAHQDDIEIMAYSGIAECFGDPGKWFGGITVTDGAGSPRTGIYADYTDEEMKKVRLKEQRKAAFLGEYSFQIQLGYPSKTVKDPGDSNVVEDLVRVLERTNAEIFYLHNPADKHDTHVAVLVKAIEALRRLPAEKKGNIKKVYGCEVWRSLDWMVDRNKVVLPTSLHQNLASALVSIYDSQISGGKRYDLASISRRQANATYLDTHAVDAHDSVTYAMDLTPLIKDESLDVWELVEKELNLFVEDVRARIAKFS